MSKGLIRVFVYISSLTGVLCITLEPSPTAFCPKYNSFAFTCSVSETWNSVGFYLGHNNGLENIAFFINTKGTCQDLAAPTPGLYITSCDYSSKTFHLTIKNVTDFYQGRLIECVMNPGGMESITTLNVQFAPTSTPSITQLPNGPVIEGSKVTLTCSIFGGNPLAAIVLQCHGFTNVTQTDSPPTDVHVASIERVVTKEDNGKECICTGKHLLWATNTQANHALNVYFKPFLDHTRPFSSSHIGAIENDTLQIILTVTAHPTPTIEWTFRAEEEWNSCNFSTIVSNTTTKGFFTSSSVFISNVQSNDLGDYTYTAKNTGGVLFRRFVVMREASFKQKTCENIKESTGILVAGIITLVVGLLCLSASVIFGFRNIFKNIAVKSSKSDEYTDVQKSNPAFTDEYTTLQSDIESRLPQEQSSDTYEECGRKTEAHPYNNVNAIGSEPKQPQYHGHGDP